LCLLRSTGFIRGATIIIV